MKAKSKDIIRNVAIAGTAAIPYAGGPLAFLLDKSLPNYMEKQYQAFVAELENNLNNLQKQIDPAHFKSPQFYTLFVKALNDVLTSSFKEKLLLYQNMLINTADPSYQCNYTEFFNKLTLQLSSDAVNYLYLVYHTSLNSVQPIKLEVPQMYNKLPHERDYIISFTSQLVRFRLLEGPHLTMLGQKYCEYIFTPIQTTKYIQDDLCY